MDELAFGILKKHSEILQNSGLTCQTITDEARLYLITQACLILHYTFSWDLEGFADCDWGGEHDEYSWKESLVLVGESANNRKDEEVVVEMIRDEVCKDPVFDVDPFEMWIAKEETCIHGDTRTSVIFADYLEFLEAQKLFLARRCSFEKQSLQQFLPPRVSSSARNRPSWFGQDYFGSGQGYSDFQNRQLVFPSVRPLPLASSAPVPSAQPSFGPCH